MRVSRLVRGEAPAPNLNPGEACTLRSRSQVWDTFTRSICPLPASLGQSDRVGWDSPTGCAGTVRPGALGQSDRVRMSQTWDIAPGLLSLSRTVTPHTCRTPTFTALWIISVNVKWKTGMVTRNRNCAACSVWYRLRLNMDSEQELCSPGGWREKPRRGS